jgi:transposase InsO family protein
MIKPSDRQHTVELINEAQEAGAAFAKACHEIGINVRTYQRWMQGGRASQDRRPQAKRPAPANKLTPQERDQILTICNQTAYQSIPPSQIVPALADGGVYVASESSFYRVLRDAEQLQHRGKARAPRTVTKPTGYQATAPNQVWSWDITFVATTILGLFFRLYLVMDIYSRKIVAWEVYETETAEQAAAVIHKACLIEGVCRDQLVLHSDNGAPMKGATMVAMLHKLGIIPSFSRPSVSDDNPYSESLFRTLKYTPAYPAKPFDSLSAARAWVQRFVQWYNEVHRHSGIRFVTPAARHQGKEGDILANRQAIYAAAKCHHPERWSGPTRNWAPVKEVWLNPDKSEASGSDSFENVA